MSRQKIHLFWRFVSLATLGYVRTRVFTRKKEIFLTFDDGPHPQHTPQLLDLLSHHKVRASFFLIGSECFKNARIVDRIVREGHQIGNHTATHPRMCRLSTMAQWREYSSADELLSKFIVQPELRFPVRPPSGRMTVTSVVYCFFRFRRLVLWSRDSLDGQLTSKEVCLLFQESPLKNGDVVLFHDDSSVCVEALKILLPEWKRMGYRFMV